MGEDVIRGINVKKWQSCTFIEELKATILATWTWTNTDIWQSSIKSTNSSVQFPVEMKVQTQYINGKLTEDHYEYTSYRPYISASPDIFEVNNF